MRSFYRDIMYEEYGKIILNKLENKPTLKELREIKNELIRKGFNAPYKNILTKNLSELDDETKKDIAKQIKIFREIAVFKRMIYKKVNVAIAARRLEKFVSFNSFLPFNGDYVKPLLKSKFLVKLFRYYIDLFKTYGEQEEYIKAKFRELGYEFTMNLKRESDLDRFVDLELVKTYKARRTIPLIQSKYIRIALFSSLITYVYNQLKPVDTYNLILHKHGYEYFVDAEHIEDDVLHKELQQNNLMNENKRLIDKDKMVDEKIKYQRAFIDRIHNILFKKIFLHYLLKNEKERKNDIIIPSLSINPTLKQLHIFKFVGFSFDAYSVLVRKLESDDVNEGLKYFISIKGKEYVKEYIKDKISL